MSLAAFTKLTDEKLKATYDEVNLDATKARAALVKRLDTALDQIRSATPTRGRKMWSINNGVVALTLPFHVGGKNVFHLPSERAVDAIEHLKAAIGAGEADDEITKGQAGGTKPARAPRKAREPGSGGTREWTPERRERYMRSIEARKAAKQTG